MSVFVVTGTDTGIGKTVFSAALAGALGATYFKPVQAGLDAPTDSETVAQLSGCPTLPETYRLKLAASPDRAARAANIRIDAAALKLPAARPLVVEGAGGLLVPLDGDTLYIDVFARWAAPLILCARTGLGTINHTLLSLEAIRTRRVPLLGVAFIGEAQPETEDTICRIGNVRRLGRLGPVAPLTRENLTVEFARGFNLSDFR